jgi:hypothetical protein
MAIRTHGEVPMASIDPALLSRTNQLQNLFDSTIAKLANASTIDLRLFFTMAHAYITTKIGKHVQLFSNPNSLMRLNDSFSTTYLKALGGAPHDGWQRAFRVCKAESDTVSSGFVGLLFLGPVVAESCAACMANVHINRDLRDALMKVTDVDAQDYGNILVFVQEAISMQRNNYAVKLGALRQPWLACCSHRNSISM